MIKSVFINSFLAILMGISIGCKKDKNDVIITDFDPTIHGDYFVALPKDGGSDMNPGTYEKPWATWQKAFTMADAGDTVYFRGGTWFPTEAVDGNNILVIDPDGYTPRGNSGTPGNPICFFNFPGEKPVLDCSKIYPKGNFNTGIMVTAAHHLKFKGLGIRNIYQCRTDVQAFGMSFNVCSYYSLENMTLDHISGNAVRFGSLAQYLEIGTDTITFINCDVYSCKDTLSSIQYNYADGFKGDVEIGGYVYFYGCRSWDNSDDGFDMSGPGVKVFDNCWAFNIGAPGADDGNGIKSGGVRDSISPLVTTVIKNCIIANNMRYGYHSLDYSSYYRNNGRIYNNFFYKNEVGIVEFNNPERPFHNTHFRNNIAYQNLSIASIAKYWDPGYPESHNTWDWINAGDPFNFDSDTVTVTNDDFLSLDIALLDNPRDPTDNSLPKINFGRLATGSDLIGAGIYVGMSTKPDIGIDWAYIDENED